MNWLNIHKLNWEPPLTFSRRFAQEDIALLYSGMRDQASGAISYLAVGAQQVAQGDQWPLLTQLPLTPGALPDWIGYIGYGMREQAPKEPPSPVSFPDFRLVRYAHLFRFDHNQQSIAYFHREGAAPLALPPAPAIGNETPKVTALASNLTRQRYQEIVAETLARIQAGDFYQANITRKFHGRFAQAPDSLALFCDLASHSPAAYSAYIRHQGTAILSASPECFLEITPSGTVTTRPIKGSARRMEAEAEDKTIREALAASDKNRAENLMIVDLMRNDLARVSIPQSVQVTAQSQLHSYATIHHLISTITAQKRPDCSIIDVLRACFPPGSMTGAPKIAAMRWCEAQEAIARGVYSGAIGWMSAESCAFSVVIRTLLIARQQFEFQVGGGIVADSTPEEEWQETLTKARGICRSLNIPEEMLASL